MTSDTPDLVRDFEKSNFSFTGAVQVLFDGGHGLFLTWKQVGHNMVLAYQDDWQNDPLDRVRSNANEPWGSVEGAVLRQVSLFTAPEIEGRNVVGLRHTLKIEMKSIEFWVGTGGPDFIGDSDDLWVGAGIEPLNFAQLTEVGRIGA